jgi:hypothetical protein
MKGKRTRRRVFGEERGDGDGDGEQLVSSFNCILIYSNFWLVSRGREREKKDEKQIRARKSRPFSLLSL